MKKEVIVSSAGCSLKLLLVIAVLLFAAGILWLPVVSFFASTEKEFMQYHVTVPETYEVQPLNAGRFIRTRAYRYGRLQYTKLYPIQERCLFYRGATISTHSFEKKGDWIVVSYWFNNAQHIDECSNHVRVLMRFSQFNEFKGKFESEEKDMAHKAELLRRWN